eukprot:TRINITY_DN3212_c0_g3_i1.p1 TRINITY_DN3212_c0_g3~~TRINITY_DN3212_c0_g3_i1.p1  ORF type:complete len:449 (-),score=69.63 TRINITY_DN3212_c0_g3_i1:161-1507(-)
MIKYAIAAFLFVLLHSNLVACSTFDAFVQERFEHSGKIEDICAPLERLRETNSKVVGYLTELSDTKFFKIFRVNLDVDCPFWAMKAMCTSKTKCAICECADADIPIKWRLELNKSKPAPVTTNQDFVSIWNDRHRQLDELHVEDVENDQGLYVNLKQNPEAFTGYQGQKIWETIYKENRFQGEMRELSLEERTLNRMISGLHTSISTHLSWFFIDHDTSDTPEMRRNVNLFFEKVGNYPDRIENLYFLYSLMLRAFNRAADLIRDYEYDTGDLKSDIRTKNIITKIVHTSTSQCQQPFQENELFQDVSKVEIRKQFMNYFHNISRIMNCVECEKCKMYGKLQTYGLGTALKILFNQDERINNTNLHIKRNELIAFVNTFIKFSQSIDFIDRMFTLRKAQYWKIAETIGVILVCLVLIYFASVKFKFYLWAEIRQKYTKVKTSEKLKAN